jgi:folate-dependent phosphoribosylglycinamide formyltransferase PurN
MRIILYTSSNPNVVDIYNIYKLLSEASQHEYFIIAVDRPATINNLFSRLRTWLSEKRHGINYWRKDIEAINEKISLLYGKSFIKKLKIDHIIKDGCNSLSAQNILKKYAPDIIYQCGGSIEILKENIYSIPKIGTINIHHGYAPEIRGVYSLFWALFYGLYDRIGVTAHFIEKGIDTGPVIAQWKYEMNNYDFPFIYEKSILEGGKLLIKALQKIENPSFIKDNFKTQKVNSYYFSYRDFLNIGHYRAYNKLKANGFKPFSGVPDIESKILEKKIIS